MIHNPKATNPVAFLFRKINTFFNRKVGDILTTRNWSPDEHENVIDAQNRQIALRNRVLAIQKKSENVPSLFEPWSAEDEPIVI